MSLRRVHEFLLGLVRKRSGSFTGILTLLPGRSSAVRSFLIVPCRQVPEPSDPDEAERQSEYAALSEEIDQRWLSEREIAQGEKDHGLLLPAACEETLSEAVARDETLSNALVLAAATDGGLREVYDLWGERIELLQELDREMQQGCR